MRLLLILCILPILVDSANILALLGLPSRSHHIWNTALLYRLAENGHNITMLSVDLPSSKANVPENVHIIHLEKTRDFIAKGFNKEYSLERLLKMRGIDSLNMMNNYALAIAYGIANSEGYNILMNYPDMFEFDLILNDYTMGPHLLAFVHKFHYPPLIGLTAFLNSPNTVDLIGHHYFSGYIPYWSTTYDTNMTIWERFENTFIYVYDCLLRKLITIPKLDEIFLPISPPNTPSLGELQKHTKLAFVNSHPAINYPESLPPNVIEVGGMHIKEPGQLPRNIEEYISKCDHGFIYISFGSTINSEMLSDKINSAIFQVIEDLPEYKFLFKFDLTDHNFTVPKNVLIEKFFPQIDVLSHPNLKLFVTHSGGLSTQEATWAGVPTVGFAIIVDQFRNVRKTFLSGSGLELDLLSIEAIKLKAAILEVAENPKFKENIKLRSKRFRSQQVKPLDKAIWWVEYILTDPNPSHLLSPAMEMNVFAALSLDVLVVFILVVIICGCIVVLVIFKTLKYVKIFGQRKKMKRN